MFERGGKDGDEGDLGVKDETRDAYPCGAFDSMEVKVSEVP